LSEVDTEKVRARLEERAEEIAHRRAQLKQNEEGMREGELADYDQHPADSGTDMHEQELDETTDMILAEEARAVEQAQQRLEEGLYGTCVECGKEIPAARLEAIPEAVRCIDDQQRYEGMLRERGGPPQSTV
jgi:RNA polymerase-binding transcription factor DksA